MGDDFLNLKNCELLCDLVHSRLDTLATVDREDQQTRTNLAHLSAKLTRRITEMRAGTGRSR